MELKIETARAFLPLLRPAKYCAAYGGRSSGKSRFFAGKLIERCVSRPTRAVCVREVQQSIAESVKQAIVEEVQSTIKKTWAEMEPTLIAAVKDCYNRELVKACREQAKADLLKSIAEKT